MDPFGTVLANYRRTKERMIMAKEQEKEKDSEKSRFNRRKINIFDS